MAMLQGLAEEDDGTGSTSTEPLIAGTVEVQEDTTLALRPLHVVDPDAHERDGAMVQVTITASTGSLNLVAPDAGVAIMRGDDITGRKPVTTGLYGPISPLAPFYKSLKALESVHAASDGEEEAEAWRVLTIEGGLDRVNRALEVHIHPHPISLCLSVSLAHSLALSAS